MMAAPLYCCCCVCVCLGMCVVVCLCLRGESARCVQPLRAHGRARRRRRRRRVQRGRRSARRHARHTTLSLGHAPRGDGSSATAIARRARRRTQRDGARAHKRRRDMARALARALPKRPHEARTSKIDMGSPTVPIYRPAGLGAGATGARSNQRTSCAPAHKIPGRCGAVCGWLLRAIDGVLVAASCSRACVACGREVWLRARAVAGALELRVCALS